MKVVSQLDSRTVRKRTLRASGMHIDLNFQDAVHEYRRWVLVLKEQQR